MPDSSRARSFGPVPVDYHRHRPGYPDAAVDWALGGVRGTVLDLGAGTGKPTGAGRVGRGDPAADGSANAFDRVRTYLAGRPELGETFGLPLRTIAVRMLRR
jgi:hypothetical protein